MPTPPPAPSYIWQTTRLFGACLLSYLIAYAIGLPEKYWALITTIVVTQPLLADTLTVGRDRMLGTLVGAAVGFLVLELSQKGLPLLPLFWLALLPTTWFIAQRPYLRLAAVTLVVVVLVPSSGSPYARPFDRVIEILIGTLAAVVVAAMVRPKLLAERRARNADDASAE